MLRPRWYKVLNDLLGNKTRTLLIVLSMAVGLFAVGIILSARTYLSDGLAISYASIHPSSGTVHTDEPFDEAFIQSVRSMKDVQDADARRNIPARVKVAGNDWKNINLFLFPDYNEIRVNKVVSQSGAWPPPDHEILIERAALAVIKAQVGDTVLIKLPDDTQRAMRIAGTTYDPALMPAQIDGTPYGYISENTLEWLGQPFGFNELHVVAIHPENKAWAQQVVNQVKDKAERAGYTIPVTMTTDPGQVPMNDILQGILILMGILGVMSLFLSIFLVINTVSAILAQQKRQIGVMKAIGGSSMQILGMYLVMVLVYGILALLIAVPLGLVGARQLSQAMATFFNFDLPAMEIQPQAILFQVAIGLLLPVLASLFPFITNLKISAAEAMSTYIGGKGRLGRNLFNRLFSGTNLWFARLLPIRSMLLSLRNTFRSQGRLALTLITLTLGAATFISVFSVRSSLSSTVDDMLKWFNFDVMMSFDRSYRADKVQLDALSMPGIEKTDIWLQLAGRRVRPDGTESGLLYIFASRADSDLIRMPAVTAGRALLPQDENAVVVTSGLFLDEPDLGLGDDIVLKIYGKEHAFRIVGVCVGSSYATMIFGNYPYVARVTDKVGQADAIMLTMAAHDAATVDGKSAALEAYYEQKGMRIDTVTSVATEKAETEDMFDVLVALLLVMAVLLALVGGLGLMGTMSINVLERTREIGVLRAIGASNRGVAQVFILEGITIGVLSWAFGGLLAIPMSQGFNQAVGYAVIGIPLTFSYSMPGLWSWLVIVILLSAVSSYIPARNASRLTVREVLAYE